MSQTRFETDAREMASMLDSEKDRVAELEKAFETQRLQFEELTHAQAAAVADERGRKKADMLADMMAKIDTVSLPVSDTFSLLTDICREELLPTLPPRSSTSSCQNWTIWRVMLVRLAADSSSRPGKPSGGIWRTIRQSNAIYRIVCGGHWRTLSCKRSALMTSRSYCSNAKSPTRNCCGSRETDWALTT